MKILEPSISVDWLESGQEILRRLEAYGRTAYKSEDKIDEGSAGKFIGMIVLRGHLSVLEHVAVSVRVICDRGISHEIVRHRIASYTQESTRYCNYAKGEFGGELAFILPSFLKEYYEEAINKRLSVNSQRARTAGVLYREWLAAMKSAERTYIAMIGYGAKPQEARSVLPNSLKTEIVMTMNLREWLHFFRLRTASSAHPDMQVVANAILVEFKAHIPVIFCEVL